MIAKTYIKMSGTVFFKIFRIFCTVVPTLAYNPNWDLLFMGNYHEHPIRRNNKMRNKP